MRILVTGDNGLLGSSLMPALMRSHQVTGINDADGDIVDSQFVQATVQKARPQAIVHLAAYTAVDRCEADAEAAFRVNAEGTQVVAEAALMHDAHLVTISTDYVFDGRGSRPYLESDAPNPLSVYGKSKLAAEDSARNAGRWTILRSAWLFGPHRPNFVTTILGLLEDRPTLSVVNDQTGSPTYTPDLAWGIQSVVEGGLEGLYHLAGPEPGTWYDLACEAVRVSGGDPSRVEPGTTAALNRPAPRPVYSVLDSGKAWRRMGGQFRGWREGVQHYLRSGNK